jgi:hypothetical protein
VQQCLTGIHAQTGTLWAALAMCLAIISAEAQFDVTNAHLLQSPNLAGTRECRRPIDNVGMT